jgi:hypothetical protein
LLPVSPTTYLRADMFVHGLFAARWRQLPSLFVPSQFHGRRMSFVGPSQAGLLLLLLLLLFFKCFIVPSLLERRSAVHSRVHLLLHWAVNACLLFLFKLYLTM